MKKICNNLTSWLSKKSTRKGLVIAFTTLLAIPLFSYASVLDGAIDFISEEVLGRVAQFFMWIFFVITGFFMSIGAYLLDLAITTSISTQTLNNVSSIQQAWTVLRDLANMFFIFILLYIAIATILQIGNVQWKQALARVIIVALLINFSLFFTRVIIDASNMLAVGFYNSTKTTITTSKGTVDVYGPSTTIMSGMKLQSIFSADTWDNPAVKPFDKALLYFFGSIFQAITGFVFLTGAIIFIKRIVAFIFLMILSPLAFVGWILPATKPYSDRWWKSLLQNAFIAPAFLAVIYVVTIILSTGDIFGISGAGNSKFVTSITSQGREGGYEIYLNFAIVIGLMWGAIVVAEGISSGMTSSAMKWAKRATGAGVAGGAMGVAMAGRYGIGGAAKWASENKTLQNMQSKGGALGRVAGGGLVLSDKISKSSMDVRNTALGRQMTSRLGKESTIGSSVGEGGYRKSVFKQGVAGFGGESGRQSQEAAAKLAATDAKTGKPNMREVDKVDSSGNIVRDANGNPVKEMRSYAEVAARKFEQRAKSAKTPEERSSYEQMAKRTRAGDQEADKLNKAAASAKRKDDIDTANATLTADKDKAAAEFANLSNQDIARLKPEVLADPKVAKELDEKMLYAIMQNKDLNLTSQQLKDIRRAASGGTHGTAVADWLANNPTGQNF